MEATVAADASVDEVGDDGGEGDGVSEGATERLPEETTALDVPNHVLDTLAHLRKATIIACGNGNSAKYCTWLKSLLNTRCPRVSGPVTQLS